MYQLNDSITYPVLRLTDGAFIPADPGNSDWREYQQWLAAGNEPLPAEGSPS